MKQAVILLFILTLPVVFFSSCGKDDVDYGYDIYEEQIATVKLIDDKPAYLLDNGKLLYDAGTGTSTKLENKQRVYLNYTILPDSTSNFDQTVRVNRITSLSSRSLQVADSSVISALPNDPVFFESAWIGSSYLNLIFDFEYKSQPHKIYLVTTASKVNNQYIYLDFRHDKNNDTPGYKSHVIASFDLKEVLGPPEKKKKLFVNFNTSNYGNKTYEFDY